MNELADAMKGSYEFSFRTEGSLYVYEFPRLSLTMRISRLVAHSDSVKGWLDVRSQYPGDPDRLLTGDANLSGPRARKELAKHLSDRSRQELDWDEVLEAAFIDAIERLAEGEPFFKANEIAPREHSRFRIEPISFERLPVIWFGKGGTGKTLLSIAAAMGMHTDTDIIHLPLTPGPSLFLDWETDKETWHDQVELLARGAGIDVPDLHYRECTSSLVHQADSIGRFIDREGVETVVIDSLGAACGDDKNSQEVATRMFNAIRGWGVTPICLDHIAKNENTNTPYGSVYFETSARATWRTKGASKGNDHFLSLALEKSNLGRYEPVHFKFTFEPDMARPSMILVEKVTAKEIPASMKGEGTEKMKIRTALLEGRQAMSVEAIAENSGVSKANVRARLKDLVEDGEVVKVPILGGVNKWGLVSHADSEAMGEG